MSTFDPGGILGTGGSGILGIAWIFKKTWSLRRAEMILKLNDLKRQRCRERQRRRVIFSDRRILFSKQRATALHSKVIRRGVIPRTDQQKVELWQLCCLVAGGRISEHWLIDAAEAVATVKVRPRDPLAYFWWIVRGHAKSHRTDVNRLLHMPLESETVSDDIRELISSLVDHLKLKRVNQDRDD